MTTEFAALLQHLQKRIDLTPVEAERFLSAFRLTKVKKRQFIIQPEFVARYRSYVVQGAFRSYVVGDEGQEHTIQLAVEDWWITDYNSYIYQQPATLFVVALEDSIILQIDHPAEWALKAESHHFETFFRTMAERSTAYMLRRLITNLTLSADERYAEMEAKYPQFTTRIPQYALASFLGMTTEYLSKLRNRRTVKKS